MATNDLDDLDVLDVLVVGAGPTGLALAVQLTRFGIRYRIVDALTDRRRESRAIVVHARTLELLDTVGLAEPLVARGRRGVRVRLHLGTADVTIATPDRIQLPGTRFPFALFVSQYETESLLAEWLAAHGATVERGCTAALQHAAEDNHACQLTHDDGRVEIVRARFIVGCDGAHSGVRHTVGIPFDGDAYPQRFLLADVDIDGAIEGDALHAFPGAGGALVVLPLGGPRPWRVIAIDPATSPGADGAPLAEVTLEDLQACGDRVTGRALHFRNPAWLTRFRLHHRQAATYRRGRVFLAGDAAHIHSPAGGQGMNTGIQDAWNLGWKLALVIRGAAREALLDTYHAERWPVGRFLLRFTDRLFAIGSRAVTARPAAARVRNALLRWVLPRLASSSRLRVRAFRVISQLGIRYRRSPAVREGLPSLAGGPRAGDRVPDTPLDGEDGPTLHQLLRAPSFHLLVCGVEAVPRPVAMLAAARDITIVHLPARSDGANTNASTLAALGVEPRSGSRSALYLVRPDGHIAYRAAGVDAGDLSRYLDEWIPGAGPSASAHGV